MKNIKDLTNEVSKSGAGGASKDQIEAIIKKTFSVITQEMAADEDVRIANFGTFSAPMQAEREGRNPATGETIKIPAQRKAKFKALPSLKDLL